MDHIPPFFFEIKNTISLAIICHSVLLSPFNNILQCTYLCMEQAYLFLEFESTGITVRIVKEGGSVGGKEYNSENS